MIGADCDIRENVTANTGTEDDRGVTEIGDHCFLMAGSHVAHDCKVGNHVTFANNVALGGHVVVGDNVVFGGGAAVRQFVRIGEGAMIVGLSGVRADVIPYALAHGPLADLVGLNVVGLRRRGVAREQLHQLREAYQAMFFGEGTFKERVTRVEARIRRQSVDRQGARFYPQRQAAADDGGASRRWRRTVVSLAGRADDSGPLGILCGGGSIPSSVADAVSRSGRDVVLFALIGWADPAFVAKYRHYWIHIGRLGEFCRLAAKERCRDIVFVGTLLRPSLSQVRLDWATIKAFPRIMRAFRGGDDHLLTGIGRIFEDHGFRLRGAHEVAPEILIAEGALGKHKPTARDQSDIARGLAVLAAIGSFDIGQAAVVADGNVVALEAAEGTDQMLAARRGTASRGPHPFADGRWRAGEGTEADAGSAVRPAGDRAADNRRRRESRACRHCRGCRRCDRSRAGSYRETRGRCWRLCCRRAAGVMTARDTIDDLADRAGIAVAMVACEESGDRLGAALMRALVAKSDKPIMFSGVGGPDMEREGMRSLFPIGELAIVGIDAVIAKLPMILRRIRETADAVIAANPDMLVIIDSPDFTHRVARKVRAAAPHIRIVDYVSPSVWAWRPGRARAMRAYVDHVLALLPFEPATHERLGGPPCTYVGHPVVEIANRLRPE